MQELNNANTKTPTQTIEKNTDTQGRGRYTREKEMVFANTIESVFKSYRTALFNIKRWGDFPFHHVDLFSGCGLNIPYDGGEPIEGSPLIAAKNFSMFTPADIQLNPYFIESNETLATSLKNNLTTMGYPQLAERVYNYDAQEFLPLFSESVARRERREMAMGILIVDPNSLYRSYDKKNKRAIGIHVAALREFMLLFKKMDVLMRIDLRFHHMAVGHILYNANKAFLNQVMPIETLLGTYLPKTYWFVNNYDPKGKALIVFGSNFLKGIQGMSRIDKERGREIIKNAEAGSHRGWSYNPLIPESIPTLPIDEEELRFYADLEYEGELRDETENEDEYNPDWSAFNGNQPEEE